MVTVKRLSVITGVRTLKFREIKYWSYQPGDCNRGLERFHTSSRPHILKYCSRAAYYQTCTYACLFSTENIPFSSLIFSLSVKRTESNGCVGHTCNGMASFVSGTTCRMTEVVGPRRWHANLGHYTALRYFSAYRVSVSDNNRLCT